MPSLWETLKGVASDLAADTTTITWDAPGGFYDRLHGFIEQHTKLSGVSRNGCLALIAGASAAHSVLRQNTSSGPLGNYASGVFISGVRQVGRRALNDRSGNGQPLLPDQQAATRLSKPAIGRTAFLEVEVSVQTKLLAQRRGLTTDDLRQLYQNIVQQSTPEQLKHIAELTPEDVTDMLQLLGKHTLQHRTKSSIRSGIVELTARLNRLAGKQ